MKKEVIHKIPCPGLVESEDVEAQPIMQFREPNRKFLVYFQRTRMIEYRKWLKEVKNITKREQYFAQRILIT